MRLKTGGEWFGSPQEMAASLGIPGFILGHHYDGVSPAELTLSGKLPAAALAAWRGGPQSSKQAERSVKADPSPRAQQGSNMREKAFLAAIAAKRKSDKEASHYGEETAARSLRWIDQSLREEAAAKAARPLSGEEARCILDRMLNRSGLTEKPTVSLAIGAVLDPRQGVWNYRPIAAAKVEIVAKEI